MILLVLGLFGAALGIGGFAKLHSAERAAAQDFHDRLGPDSKVNVHMTPSGTATLHGDLAKVRVRAKDFSVSGLPLYLEPDAPRDGRIKQLEVRLERGRAKGFEIDKLEATLPEVRYDFRRASRHDGIVISACGEGTFRVELSAATMAKGAMKRDPALQDVHVTLSGTRMHLEGTAKFAFGSIPIEVEGILIARNGHELALDGARIKLSGKPVSQESASKLVGALNPLIDFDKDIGTPGMLTLLEVKSEKGRLILQGTMRLQERPKS